MRKLIPRHCRFTLSSHCCTSPISLRYLVLEQERECPSHHVMYKMVDYSQWGTGLEHIHKPIKTSVNISSSFDPSVSWCFPSLGCGCNACSYAVGPTCKRKSGKEILAEGSLQPSHLPRCIIGLYSGKRWYVGEPLRLRPGVWEWRPQKIRELTHQVCEVTQ